MRGPAKRDNEAELLTPVYFLHFFTLQRTAKRDGMGDLNVK